MEIFGLVLLICAAYFLKPWWRNSTTSLGAPFVPLSPENIESIMRLADVGKSDVFYDLGCGDGRVAIAAALRGAKAIGIEILPLRVVYAKIWISLLRFNKKIEIISGDIFKQNLSKATIVCLYLLPETHQKLKAKLSKELKKGTRVIAVAFPIDGWKPVKVNPHGPIYGPIYLYII